MALLARQRGRARARRHRRCRRCARCPGACRTRPASSRGASAGTTSSRRRRAWGGGHEGLAIVSRFPIGAHEAQPLPHSIETEGRIILSARIDARADAAPFWVHTTHLSYREARGAQARGPGAVHRRGDRRARQRQRAGRDGRLQRRPRQRRDPLADRHDHARRAAGRLPGRLGAREPVGSGGTTAASPGPARTPTSIWMHWLRPDRRLDYIFTTPVRRDRRATVHGARVVFDEPRRDGRRASACSRRITSASSRTCRWWRSRPMRRPERGGMFLLAHVTDPHFRGFAGASPADFMNKRALGTLNLLVNRTRKHKMELLEALRAGPARAGARSPGADRRFRERVAAGRVAGGAGVDRHLRARAGGDQRDPRESRRVRRDGRRVARVREAVRAVHDPRSGAARRGGRARRLSVRPDPRRHRVRRRLQLGGDRRLRRLGADRRGAARAARGDARGARAGAARRASC